MLGQDYSTGRTAIAETCCTAGVSIRDRIIEHLSNRAMSGIELAHATGYSQVSIYKALRTNACGWHRCHARKAPGSKKNFLLSRTKMATGACDQIAVTARIDDRVVGVTGTSTLARSAASCRASASGPSTKGTGASR